MFLCSSLKRDPFYLCEKVALIVEINTKCQQQRRRKREGEMALSRLREEGRASQLFITVLSFYLKLPLSYLKSSGFLLLARVKAHLDNEGCVGCVTRVTKTK